MIDSPRGDSHQRQAVFTDILRKNAWGNQESLSGPGSTVARTAAFRTELVALFHDLQVRSLLDAPCGDFNWMKEVSLEGIRYMGIDIVPALSASNRARYATPMREFRCLDIVTDALPAADLILCRDALVHLSFAEIRDTLRNFQRSGARYLLTTSFTEHSENMEIPTGGWRTLNLQLPPFNLPAPWQALDEKCLHSGGRYADKILGLWHLADLQL